jgi:hypothetical protein
MDNFLSVRAEDSLRSMDLKSFGDDRRVCQRREQGEHHQRRQQGEHHQRRDQGEHHQRREQDEHHQRREQGEHPLGHSLLVQARHTTNTTLLIDCGSLGPFSL